MKLRVSRKRPKPYVEIERGKFRLINEYGELMGFGSMPKGWPPPGLLKTEDAVHIMPLSGNLGRAMCDEHGQPMSPIDFDIEQDSVSLGEYFMAKAVELIGRQGGQIFIPTRDR
jgi:hypothetical protein